MSLIVRGEISAAEAAAALALAAAAAAVDGVAPLSEQVRLHLRYGGDRAASNLLLRRDGDLLGFAHVSAADPATGRDGELVVHPGNRGQGLGRALADAIVSQAGPSPVRVWAHGDLPAAARLARAAGFARVRALWRMSRPLPGGLAQAPPPPAGISLRTFVPGRDEESWLALNAKAFAGHPEQGHWTREDLDRREREPWFDPAGFFLAERDGRPVGFHWTKIHPPGEPGTPAEPGTPGEAGTPAEPGTPGEAGTPAEPETQGELGGPGEDGRPGNSSASREAAGEVYVLGVDPAEQRTGLGRLLTLAGLHHLSDRGLPTVMLYVEETNAPAIRLYESLGFSHVGTDVMYEHRPR